MIMKLRFLLVLLMAALCVLAGCQTTQPPVTTQVIAGNYAFVSKDPESRSTDHNLNHLVLQSDGTYDLIEGGATKAVSEKKGTWSIVPESLPTLSSITPATRLRSGEMRSGY